MRGKLPKLPGKRAAAAAPPSSVRFADNFPLGGSLFCFQFFLDPVKPLQERMLDTMPGYKTEGEEHSFLERFDRIEEELKNAAAYMNLQLELHDNNFQFEKDIEEGLEEFVTINLMLQPLLENAVKHGVDKLRDKSAKRLIRLTARWEGGDLRFTVYNTGSVIQPQVLRSVFVEKTQGYGLRNVDERIRLLFGEAYGIRIEGTEDGTLCVITIPQRREEDL